MTKKNSHLDVSELAKGLAWYLAHLYEPVRTKAGAPAKKYGAIQYKENDLIQFCGRYLGASFKPATLAKVVNQIRVPTCAENAVRTCLERLRDGKDVAQEVRRDVFRMNANFGLRTFIATGYAPDGGATILGWLLNGERYARGSDIDLLEQAARLDGWSSLRRAEADKENVPIELKPLFNENGTISENSSDNVKKLVEGRLCHL